MLRAWAKACFCLAFALGCQSMRARALGADPAPALSQATPVELVLSRALPIQVEDDFQPSGLAWQDGHLLTVSDKHDAGVYELLLEGDAARLRPFVTFEPPLDEPTHLDLEGLSVADDGRLLVVSESRFRVASITFSAHAGGEPPYPGVARWVTASLRDKGRAGGLFQVDGANFEGLTRLPAGGILLAGERQPRGLMELGSDLSEATARVWAMPTSKYPLPSGRNSDFTDLTLADGEVYALVRNAHLVVNLRKHDGAWREGRAFSYAAAENDARFAYADRVYGLGEGLAIAEHQIFVVLDNNQQARGVGADDRRPLLFVFERPRGL